MEGISEHIYNLLLSNSREIVIFFKRNGQIIDCNKAAKEILEYGDAIYNANISDIYRDAIRVKKDRLIIYSKYNNMAYETSAYKMDQTCLPVELKIIIKRYHGRFIGLCIASDITMQKKLTKKVKRVRNDMKKLLKLKDRAISNITHELRTPVSAIMGMSEILLNMEFNQEQSDNIDIIYQYSKRIDSLINDLFDIVRIKNNKLILLENEFNIHTMINRASKLYQYRAEEKHLKLRINISENVPLYLIGDEFRLSQIIDNLLSNAIKFTKEGAIILNVSTTSLKDDQVELLFMVIDTGIGIADEYKEKIFMRYYQVDGSISRGYEGAGLGLFICQMLAKAMGGRISVKSTKGEGSTFLFTISLRKATTYYEEERATISNEASKSISVTKDNILIEKLKTVIEKEDWQYAEQLALKLRKMIPHEDKPLANKVLQLLFSIRNEEREQSIKRLDKLKEIKNMHP